MPKETKRLYAINFDLKIVNLERYYSKTNPKGAYKEIASYMKSNGFSHRQWSGYISDKTMTRTELVDFTEKIHKHFPWLIKCEEKLDATVITGIFDIKQMIIDGMDDSDVDIDIEK